MMAIRVPLREGQLQRIQNKVARGLRAALFVMAPALVLASSGGATSAPGDTVADRVFGQGGSFATDLCNNGAVGASSLCTPQDAAVDAAGNLYVADSGNNRVLEYDAPLTTDMVADRVFGQPNFTTNSCAVGASGLCAPFGVGVDAVGNLFVADGSNNRVLEYNSPLTTDAVADRVFGQPNFTSNTCNNGGITASSLCTPAGVPVDASGNLYVADLSNNRVLEYNTPLTTDTLADRVFGQANFTTNSCAVGASGLCSPGDAEVDSAGNLYVPDSGNNRTLEYNTPLTTNTVADRVFGQPNFTNNLCNQGAGPTAGTSCAPAGVGVDPSGNFFVADLGNNRVLEYNTPLSTDTLADRVFGQPNFTSNTCNNGGISAGSLCAPAGLDPDSSGNLFATDGTNNRVLEYDVPVLNMTFRPSSLYTHTLLDLGTNSDTTTTLDIPSPDSVASSLHADPPDFIPPLAPAFVDNSLTIANDAAITNGAKVGNANMTVHLGIANAACNSPLVLAVPLREADTSTSDTIAPAGPPTDPITNLVGDNRGANPGDPANGLPDYLDATPSFNTTMFAASGGGPITPRARYAGHVLLLGTRNVLIQIAVFDPGALTAIPNGGWMTQALGYPAIAVVNDPTAAPVNGAGMAMCTPFSSTVSLCGRTDAVPGDAACQVDASSQTRLTNPTETRTVQTIVQVRSLRDHDNDGIENQIDSCPFTNSSPWNPRSSSDPRDPDFDNLPNDCDPTPGTQNNDQDGDGWPNLIDSCPLTANGTAAAQLDYDIASNQPVPDGGPRSDGIGAACDPNPTSPNGFYRRTARVARVCIADSFPAADSDNDGVCETGPAGTIVDPNDANSDSDGDGINDRFDNCISVANPATAGVTQTDYDMDGIGDACDLDIDGDGFSNNAESGAGNIGTDSLDPCADDSTDSAWPLDINNDSNVDTADLTTVTGNFGKAVPPAPARADIAPDPPNNLVDTADIAAMTGRFGKSCGTLFGRTTGPP